MATNTKNVEYRIDATTAGLERGVRRAEGQLSRLQKAHGDAWAAINQAEKWLQSEADAVLAEVQAREQRRQEAWQKSGAALLAFGAATTAGLALAGRAAIQWESDWAGVAKVLDATPEQMGVLEEQIRGLATVLPATSTEIAGVAAAAAQLGVANEHLVGFTATAIHLGVSTNLGAEEAAMGLARLSTVMGVSHADIGRMGSSLVALGNSFAAMEDEILAMSLRLSGAGVQIGLTSGQVMGLAAGMTAVGIQAELGGGAFSRVLGRMQAAVLEGSTKLHDFARVAGVSADEFAIAFRQRPQEAIVMFLKGLDQVNRSGGSVYTTLKDLGLGGTEIADVAGRASSAWETMADAMGVGNQAFEDGNALLEEAAERYATTESKIQLAQNSIVALGQEVGATFLPLIAHAADTTAAWAHMIGEMPEPLRETVAGVGGLAGAASLAAGAFIIGAPKVVAFNQALEHMGPRSQAFGRGLSGAASVLGGPWGIALGAAIVGIGLFADQKARATAKVLDYTRAIELDSGALGENARMVAIKNLEDAGMLAQAEKLGLNLQDVTDAVLDQGGALADVNDIIDEQISLYQSQYDSGEINIDQYKRGIQPLREFKNALNGENEAVEEGIDKARRQTEALGDSTGATKSAIGPTGELAGLQGDLAGGFDGVGGAAGDAASEVRDLRKELDDLTRTTFDAMDAEYDFEAAVRAASDSISKNGATLDTNTDKGHENWKRLGDLRDRTIKLTSAIWDETGSLEESEVAFGRGRDAMIKHAIESGLTRKEAEKLADELLGIPDDIPIALNVDARGTWATEPLFRHGAGGAPVSGLVARADGGAVVGPGGPKDDVIPALLSNGEHVLTAAEVQEAGGQDGVYRLRAAIRAGYVKFAVGGAVGEDPVQRFARGGAVLPRPAQTISDLREDVRISIQRMYMALVDGIGKEMGSQWKRYVGSGGPVVAAWRSQTNVPYSWGGGGPGGPSYGFGRGSGTVGFDCSSLMQYGWAKAGVQLPRTTYMQINVGSPVSPGGEIPGDLVFPHRGHVAGVVAPGRVIHAPYTGGHVHERAMYSHPLAIRRPKRLFDQGGVWGHGQDGVNLSGANERVLSPRQTVAFERLVDGLLTRGPAGGDGAAAPVHYHVHHVPGYSTVQDLQRAEAHRQRGIRAGRRG